MWADVWQVAEKIRWSNMQASYYAKSGFIKWTAFYFKLLELRRRYTGEDL